MSSQWKCAKCSQVNVGWAKECGRCQTPRSGPKAEGKHERCPECGHFKDKAAIEGIEVDGEVVALKFTDFDDAIIGTAPQCWDSSGQRPERVVYSGEKLMEILVSRDGMDHDGAAEWISFNMEGAYVGPCTPIVMWPYDPEGVADGG